MKKTVLFIGETIRLSRETTFLGQYIGKEGILYDFRDSGRSLGIIYEDGDIRYWDRNKCEVLKHIKWENVI